MDQITWDKPNITAEELDGILHMQYGPECTTRVLMEDRNRSIPYKAAVINCECTRCGNTFMMSPFALVNSLYLNGYVCTRCGTLSDSQVKAIMQEDMRVKTIDTLKEHGIDILEQEFGKKDKQKSEDPLEDEYSSSADESELDDEYDLEETTEEPTVSEESATPEQEEEIVEEENTEEVNDYMVSDDDYSGTIGDSVEEEVDEETEIETEESTEEKVEEDVSEEIIEDEDIPEDTGDDAADDEIIDESDTEEVEVEEENDDISEDVISTDDIFGVESGEPEQEEELETVATEDDNNPEMIWINDDPYTSEEVAEEFRKATSEINNKLHYIPFDLDTCEIQDNKIWIKCKECGERVSFDSFTEFATIEPIDVALSKYDCGKLIKGKINNYKKITPMISRCSVCTDSLIKNGFNEFHKKRVLDFCEKAHIELVDQNKHLFINDNNESFLVKINGISKTMRYSEMLYRYTDRANNTIKDARLDSEFIAAEPKKSTESVKPKVITETVKVEEKVTDTIKETKSAFTMPKTEPVVKPAAEPQPEKITLRPKSYDDYKREAEAKSEEIPMSHSSPNKKSVFSFSETGTAGSMFESDRANDSMSDLEADRLKQERDIQKKNVFSIGQKFKIGKKDIARLNGKINPFERESSLRQEFEETVFFDFIEQLSQKTEIDYKLVLNDSTYEIPVIDFESGLRIICSNLKESDLINAHYEWINPRVPFSFFESFAENDGTGTLKKKRKKYKWCVLFSDSVEYARDATFAALVKYVNPKILAYEGKKVVLQDNLIFQYTKHHQYLRDFDKRNSTFPSKKPCSSNGSIGIIARWNSSNQATAKDVLKFKLQMESNRNGNVSNLDTLANEYNEYMVASIKYIEQFNKETNRVIYTITEYVEVGSSIIADGFAQCLRALLKEYMIKYPQFSATGIDPFVVVEIDPSSFPSPSLYSYIERGTLCKVDNAFKSMMTGQMNVNQGVDRTYRFSYVRRPEYRRSVDIDHMRQDRRMFTTGSLINRMSEEIKQAGLSNTIRNPEVKKQFISNMGYVEAIQPEIKLYFVNRSVLATFMVDGYTMALQEHIDENNFNATKMVNDSTIGVGTNNVMMNPNLMMKYNNIMQTGSAEAKDLFNRMVQEDYQQKMMDMMMNSQGQGQQAQATMNPNPMMNNQFGMMNPMGMGMPGMMGMNPMMGMGF